MAEINHYTTLGLPESATQAQIKQAYRQLAKQLHPDSRHPAASHEQITGLNAAYEVLGNPSNRQQYDRYRAFQPGRADRSWRQRTADMQSQYQQQRQAARAADSQLDRWLQTVYAPIDRLISKIVDPLSAEVRSLSADPFDDELMADFQAYLEDCREQLETAQRQFKSMANPPTVAGVAANLYYCLNQLEDGIEEMERFTYCYEESYLHTGQELFRISVGLRQEARAGMGAFA
ncbi:DnaJ domain-containing protein [Romeria aff. gracilis LEGE 07310]|uniref:DnaJ domain-containing protein n=1 Tax=Vasconcelosia minhoensis LEGE 07310 TaxID=915328 RepID=A0A8J7AEG5_9CYAN|nr:J domain-containing protein [Romeria gracilis]MBE9078161.1 DnaJ domain-containing protein [Romeria aff. gracilis LEGE 07310]